ncbi:MAG: polyphenol oxidase family protein [Actinobacteria bacterium]|nr:polyphenol oxidase family protein [Actinomycetota bacterium]
MAALVAWPSRPEVTFAIGTRRDGDARLDGPEWGRVTSTINASRWTLLTEEHGNVVRVVDTAGEHCGRDGDAIMTSAVSTPIGVWVGDCAPIGLVGDRSIAVVHAGWRGLENGVVEAAVDAMVSTGDVLRGAMIGPHIRTCCYEFGSGDLDRLAHRFGAAVRGVTRESRPAFDVNAAIRIVLGRSRVVSIVDVDRCTGCRADAFFSHRVRRENERHLFGAWITESPA